MQVSKRVKEGRRRRQRRRRSAYQSSAMASRLQLPGDDSVLVRVTHSNIKSFSADVRFSLEVFDGHGRPHSLTHILLFLILAIDSTVRWPWNPSRISCGRSVVLRSIPCSSNSTTLRDPKSLTSTTLRGHSASTLLRTGQSICHYSS